MDFDNKEEIKQWCTQTFPLLSIKSVEISTQQKQQGYLSDVRFFEIVTSPPADSSLILVIKIPPKNPEEFLHELISKTKIYLKESLFYQWSSQVQQMLQMPIHVPEVMAAKVDEETGYGFIALKHLQHSVGSNESLYTVPHENGFSHQELMLAANSLARIHALSSPLLDKLLISNSAQSTTTAATSGSTASAANPQIQEFLSTTRQTRSKLEKIEEQAGDHSVFVGLFTSNVEALKKHFVDSTNSVLSPEQKEELSLLVKQIQENFESFYQKDNNCSSAFNDVFSHGDIWVNNILFSKNQETEVTTTAYYLDFQFFGIRHACEDLACLLYSSAANPTTQLHEAAIKEYFDEFKRTWAALLPNNEELQKHLSFPLLLEEYQKHKIRGFIFYVCSLEPFVTKYLMKQKEADEHHAAAQVMQRTNFMLLDILR